MDCAEVKKLLDTYAGTFYSPPLVSVVEGRIYDGEHSESVEDNHIEIARYDLQLYPAFTKQPSVFGPRLKAAWIVDDAILGTVFESPHPGEAIFAIIRIILEKRITEMKAEIATVDA